MAKDQSKQGSKASNSVKTSGAEGVPTSNDNYNLISILYHALQGAETCEQYLEDVEDGDERLYSFIEETRAEHAERAAKAQRLLAECLGIGDMESQEDQDEDGRSQERANP